jgi:predicted small metal-binding protein
MVKLSCPATGCKYVINGMNKEEALEKMAEHRKRAHGRKEKAEDKGPEFR